MRTIPIELAYASCLVSPWMHNRSMTRAGATSSYKLQLVLVETVLVVGCGQHLIKGTDAGHRDQLVTTTDVHLEVPQVLSNALSGTIKDITLL